MFFHLRLPPGSLSFFQYFLLTFENKKLMLIPDLYTVIKSELIDDSLNSIITINPAHKIFEGHFPDNPILPGVVQLQIIKELLETELNKPLTLKKGSNIKYTSTIVPKQDKKLEITIGLKFIDDRIKVNTVIKNSETVFLKFKGTFN